MRWEAGLTQKVHQALVGQKEELVVTQERDSLRSGLSLWGCVEQSSTIWSRRTAARLAAEPQLDVVANTFCLSQFKCQAASGTFSTQYDPSIHWRSFCDTMMLAAQGHAWAACTACMLPVCLQEMSLLGPMRWQRAPRLDTGLRCPPALSCL